MRWVKDLSNSLPSWVSRARGHWRLLGSGVEFMCLLREEEPGCLYAISHQLLAEGFL